MQRMTVLALLLAVSCGGAAASSIRSREHPVVKIISLLDDLAAKVKAQGETEEVSYTKFMYWCKTSIAEVTDAITEEKNTIEGLEETIDAKTKEIEVLGEEIKDLQTEIGELQSASKKARDDNKERADLYTKTSKDLGDTIQAMKDAVAALEDASKTDGFLFAQSKVRSVFALIATVASEKQQDTLMDFVGGDPKESKERIEAMGDYGKHVKKYSFKSDNVIELLKTLQMKFEDDLTEATKAETNALNAYELSTKARDNAEIAALKSRTEKEKAEKDAESALNTAKSDLKDTKDDLKADSKTLSQTKQDCSTKTTEWDERTEIRAQELNALASAKEILAKVTGVRTKAPGNPVPPPAPTDLIQTLSLLQVPRNPDQQRVVNLLKQTATKYHSKMIERLAMEVDSHVPKQFQDIINMIQKMIFRLKQEQTDEDTHKAWCDLEIEKTNTSIADKKTKIEELTTKIDEAEATVLKLKSDIQEADKMVSDIKAFQEEATEIRTVGKKENALAIKDAEDAQKAITNAMAVITSFYKSSGAVQKEAWEFIQKKAPTELADKPEIFDGSYSAVADPKDPQGGIITMLETVSADFAKMEATTRAQEGADQKDYEDTMKAQSIELARRSKESDMKGAESKRLVDKITTLTSQKKHVSDELESTEQYEKDLQPACVEGDSTYEDRKAARTAEIDSLGEAQGILDTAFAKNTTLVAKKTFLAKTQPHIGAYI